MKAGSTRRRAPIRCLIGYFYSPPEDDDLRPCPDPRIERLLVAAKREGYVTQHVAKHSGVWWECAPGKKSRALRARIVGLLPATWVQVVESSAGPTG